MYIIVIRKNKTTLIDGLCLQGFFPAPKTRSVRSSAELSFQIQGKLTNTNNKTYSIYKDDLLVQASKTPWSVKWESISFYKNSFSYHCDATAFALLCIRAYRSKHLLTTAKFYNSRWKHLTVIKHDTCRCIYANMLHSMRLKICFQGLFVTSRKITSIWHLKGVGRWKHFKVTEVIFSLLIVKAFLHWPITIMIQWSQRDCNNNLPV